MSKLKTKTKIVIEDSDWDELVMETYKRPYCFQQQDGCQERGTVDLTVPGCADDFKNTTVPEIVNDKEMGVSFEAWLARDPKQPLSDPKEDNGTAQWAIGMWWGRNFYPELQTLANDLHDKGLLDAGEYVIDIDW